MALRGTLGDFSLADILQLIGLQRKTGSLVLTTAGETVKIGFDNGRVVSAESSHRTTDQKIGQLLVRKGKLTDARLEEALRYQSETLQRLGHILHEKRFVDRETLRRQLMLQISETVYGLFRWKDGEYDFQPQARVEWDHEFIDGVPTEHLLMEGARISDEWPIVERVIPDPRIVLRPTRAAARVLASAADSKEAKGTVYEQDIDFGFIPADPLEETSHAPRLAPQEAALLRWVDGRRPAAEIVELTEIGAFESYKTLARLMEMRLIEPADDAALKTDGGTGLLTRLFRSALGAQVVAVIVAGLTLVGAVNLIWPTLQLIRPRLAPWPGPAALTSSTWLSRTTGLSRLRQAANVARLSRVEHAIHVYYLDTSEWPQRLSDLVDHGLLPARAIRDPWGQPYGYQLFIWGYRLSPLPGVDGEATAVRERRFSVLEQTVSNVARLGGSKGAEP